MMCPDVINVLDIELIIMMCPDVINVLDIELIIMMSCGYVADKIGRLCSGKSKEEEAIKPISERKCVLSNGVGPQNGSGPGVTPVTKNPYPNSPPPSYDSVAT
ncbi:hypothetical protein ACF0H5_015169 [Mactra antiquata]